MRIYHLSDAVQKAKLLQLLHSEFRKGSEDNKQNTLEAMELGFLGTFHRSSVEKGTMIKKPLPTERANKLLTADEYINNVFNLSLNPTIIPVLQELDTRVLDITDKTSKHDLLAIIKEYQALFIAPEQRETYSVMQTKELEAMARYAGLSDAGFRDITRLDNGTITSVIDAASAKDSMVKLKELGFVLVTHSFDISTGLISLTFKEGIEETIV
ncbi:MAG: hypothetical protein ACXW1B_03100 [Nitrososphaeraceae archaeon]